MFRITPRFAVEIDHLLDIRAGVIVFVAEKIRRRSALRSSATSMTLFFCALRARVALFFHQLLEAVGIDRESALARHQLGEIERETLSS